MITLTVSDLQRIITYAQKAGQSGEYIYSLTIVKPKTASQDANSLLAFDRKKLSSASESEPIPTICVT